MWHKLFFCDEKVILVIFIVSVATATELSYESSEKRPIVFQILERNDSIVLQKEQPEKYDTNILKHFLKHNADFEYNVQNIINANRHQKSEQKKMFVKRIVPHGMDSSKKNIYNKNLGIYFKPLLKVHKHSDEEPPVSFQDGDAVPDLDKLISRLDTLRSSSNDVKDKNMHRTVIDTDKVANETEHTMLHLAAMDALASEAQDPLLRKVLRSKLSGLRVQTESVHLAMLELVKDHNRMLKSIARDQPPSVNTFTIAPGVTITTEINEPPKKVQQCFWPHEPMWDFWTFKDPVHADECPPGLFLIGNVCSRLPPH